MMIVRRPLFLCLLAVPLTSQLLPGQAQAQVAPALTASYCAKYQWPGSGPALPSAGYQLTANRALCPGQWFRSESGFYTGLLKNNGNSGEFIIARGDPTVSANQASALKLNRSNADYALSLNPVGTFYIWGYTENVGWNTSFAFGCPINMTPRDNYFLSLSDAGTLTVTAGTPANPGKQCYSNNFNDPLDVNKGGVNIESITYDFDHVKAEPPKQQSGVAVECKNSTPTEQTCSPEISLTYTKTHTFTFSSNQSVQVGFKSSKKVGLPGVGEASTEWSVTGTVGFSEGYSDADTQTVTFKLGLNVKIPANTTYQAKIVGSRVKATIPFTYTGVATYKSGKTARLAGVPGTFDGVDTGKFTAEISCVQTPGGCPSGVLQRLPVVKDSQGQLVAAALAQ